LEYYAKWRKLDMNIGLKEIIAGIGGLAAAGVGAYAIAVRPWHLQWGATEEEFNAPLPGDELVPQPKHEATHAITINTAVRDVWPWLLQMGQTRGGFYSYTSLENIVGCHMKNADRVVPEWQSLRVGDVVWLHPKAPPLPVAILEPYHAIVLGGATEQGSNGAGTWGFYLKQLDERTTRLLIRIRWDRKPGLTNWLGNYAFLEPAHFVMERKMMLGIKQRAEAIAVHQVQ
jgi:hypothetical protein